MARRTQLSLLFVLLPLASACTNGEPPATTVEEPVWGLGAKADDICAPEEELCWNTADVSAMRAVLARQDEVVISQVPRAALLDALDYAATLTHKMSDAEAEDLASLQAQAATLAVDDTAGALEMVHRVNAGPLHRVTGLYYAASMAPTGYALDRALYDRPADDGDGDGLGALLSDVATLDTSSPEMQESIDLLHEMGPLGELLVGMYGVSGLLEHDYFVLNAIQFEEYDHETGRITPSGMSREAKVQEIVDRYEWAAGGLGAAAGLISSIPIAGQAVAIPGELFFVWRLHAKMAFQIAAVYGWDITNGADLFTISMMILAQDFVREGGQSFVQFMVVPGILKAVAHFAGFEVGLDVLRRVAFAPLRLIIDSVFRRGGQEFLLEAAASGVNRSLAGQLIPIIGAVVNMSVSAIWNWVAVGRMADHIHLLSRNHLTDLMAEGATYLSERQARDCMFEGLSVIAMADGTLSEREQNLYMAFLSKDYYIDERSHFSLARVEQVAHAQTLAATTAGDATRCLGGTFEDAGRQHRLSVLSHLYAMMMIDLDETSAERASYDAAVEALNGDGWFDGDEIDYDHLEYTERAILTTLTFPVDVTEEEAEVQELVESITPEDILPYLANPDPDTAAAFACGYAGDC